MSMAAAPRGSFSSDTCLPTSRGKPSKGAVTAGTAAPAALPSDDTAATLAAESLSSSPPTAAAAAEVGTTAGAAFCFPLGCSGTLPSVASGSRPSRMSRFRSISSCLSYYIHTRQWLVEDRPLRRSAHLVACPTAKWLTRSCAQPVRHESEQAVPAACYVIPFYTLWNTAVSAIGLLDELRELIALFVPGRS